MARPLRIRFPGAYYHVYNRGVEKRSLAEDDRDCKTFLQLLGDTVKKFGLELYCYCLMDNHFHLFLQTPLGNLDEAMQCLQSQYAHYFNLRYNRCGPLFQSRYKSPLVQTDAYSLILSRYIHQNPVKAHITPKAEHYPWSSYPCYLGDLPTWPWLNTQWLLSQFHPDLKTSQIFFKTFHDLIPPQEEIDRIEKMSFTLGSDSFKKVYLQNSQKGSDPKPPIRV